MSGEAGQEVTHSLLRGEGESREAGERKRTKTWAEKCHKEADRNKKGVIILSGFMGGVKQKGGRNRNRSRDESESRERRRDRL